MRAIDDILDRLGLDRGALQPAATSRCARRSPARCSRASRAPTPRARTPRSRARRARSRQWRDVPAPRRGELVRLLGEELRSEKEALGALVTLETGKIAPGGPRRGAGDDRHLRLRGRPLAPAVRPHDRVRAARAPHARDLASARAGRRDQRVQLPGRGVELELGARARVRRPRGLEAVASARRSRRSPARRCCARAAARVRRRARGPARGRDRRRRPRARSSPTTRACRSSRRPARRSWAGRSRRASRRASAARCSSSAATTR